MITKHEKVFINTLQYMPTVFNLYEIWHKIQNIYGIYDKTFNTNRYKISDKTLYKYLKKYCVSVGNGQWEKIMEV